MWKTISSRVVHKNKWWKIRKDVFKTRSTVGCYEYVNTKGGVIIVPFINKDNVILIRQYRYPNKGYFLEFPAGGIVDNSYVSAKRELEQETGYSAKKIRKIASFSPYTGLSNEICQLYVAEELFRINKKPELSEEIEIKITRFENVKDELLKYKDGKAIAAWVFVQEFCSKRSK